MNYKISLAGDLGSGKSTVAKILSKELDILYLDTGAMYRACGLKCVKMGVSVKDEEAVAAEEKAETVVETENKEEE